MHLLVRENDAVCQEGLAGVAVIREILSADMDCVTLPDVNSAVSQYLVGVIVVPGTVTIHVKVIVFKTYIAVKPVAGTTVSLFIFH